MNLFETLIELYSELKIAEKEVTTLPPNQEEDVDIPPIEIGINGKQYYLTGLRIKRGAK